MSGKLYEYENYKKDTVTQPRDISIEEFDAWDEQHEFSEEYLEKKKKMLGALYQKQQERKGRMKWIAVASFAVMLVSGTVAAYNTDYIQTYYKSLMQKEVSPYLLTDYANPKYNLPITVETDNKDDLLEFQVLQADKGTDSVTISILTTVHDTEVKPREGYDLRYDIGYMLLINGKETFGVGNGIGLGNDVHGGDLDIGDKLGLADNQILTIEEFDLSDLSIDLEDVQSVQLKITYVYRNLAGADVKREHEWDPVDVISEDIADSNEWLITIPMTENTYSEYAYDIDESYVVGSYSVKVKNVQLKPLGLEIFYENPEEDYIPGGDTNLFSQNRKNKLIMADGKKIALEKVSQCCSSGKTDDNTLIMEAVSFDVPIDPEQIVGIEADGQKIMFQ